jgi:3-oxoadipate enol-lactonase
VYVTTRLGRWFYEERGQARRPNDPAIVLMHGLLFDGGQWEPQVPPLSDLGRVVIIDGPGHGKSEVPPPFSLDDHARALVDALDALGIFKSILIGLSWGGMVAMRVALDNPMRVVALGLLDTSADAETPTQRMKYRVLNSVARSVGLPYSFAQREIAPLMFSDKTMRDRPELVEKWFRTTMGFSRLGVARSVKTVMQRPSIVDKLRAVGCPALILCGKDDRALPLQHSQAIAARVPRGTLVTIDDAGHSSTLEQPAAVNAQLVPFVREHLASFTK